MVRVGRKFIGMGAPCFVIAEAGINHNGDVELAKELIRQAAKSGADAVKFQIFHAENLVEEGTPEFEMFKKYELPDSLWKELAYLAEKEGIIFMATPFDLEAVRIMEDIGALAYKIASGDITNFELISHVARKWKPVFLSTGGATIEEVASAVDCVYGEENDRVILLHCVSCYPAPQEELNLRAINDLWRHFYLPVGFSDHSIGIEAALVAVSMGAVAIEKHFTLDKSLQGPDHIHSLTPDELADMVNKIRKIEKMFGSGRKEPLPCESEVRTKGRRGIKAAIDIPRGTIIERRMLSLVRPKRGIGVEDLKNVLGKKAKRNIMKGEDLRWEDLS
ncbi:MAG: N-acetylneuraminate synthase family protein [Synergistetes bacterium]|nr:N-acetylneuraminate synthase family protein [Synergistota bacterium]MCX8128369.1 N-acetylneuraminate synthase family protein [Synergistota bacterium]MDW8192973.1 N-acetylneuraminate synthase family protein [Synergistota bacterium]